MNEIAFSINLPDWFLILISVCCILASLVNFYSAYIDYKLSKLKQK